MIKIALVAVDIVYSADILYSYLIPEPLLQTLTSGNIVFIPFGNGNKKIKALVVETKEVISGEGLKTVMSICSEKLDEKELMLVKYMKSRYFCTYFDALKLLLPSVKAKGNAVPLYERHIKLEDDAEKLYYGKDGKPDNRFKKQLKVIKYLKQNGITSLNILIVEAEVSRNILTTMEKKKAISTVLLQKSRSPIEKKLDNNDYLATNELNEEQQKAFNDIKSELNSGKTRLLYGVTGSGKTHIFISTIDAVLESGRGALLLIPEISLTFQIIERLYSRYGDLLAILHSGLSKGEKSDEWRRIKSGKAKIVVGTRSAVFAPIKNLGLIIIDEEQEHTYKSEMSPKYHARELAAFRVMQQKGYLLLASATPSFESYYKAKSGIISYSELNGRYNGLPLPKIITVDMHPELMAGNNTVISSLLAKEIEKNFQNNEQSILFINRRGYNSYVACPKCGKVVKCPNCGIPLTFHLNDKKLRCHYCSYYENAPDICPSCAAATMRYTGIGTQKAEEQLRHIFPNLRILRMDADTVTAKNSRDEILSAFSKKKYDVLLGTQMITKGLDFSDVTLVGVLNCDSMLYSSDFRAYERTFSLLTQVTGRAGRSEKSGRAIIQTYSPSHEVIDYAIKQDYKNFYEGQSALRKALFYPPFCDICQAVFISETEERSFEGAEGYIEIIKKLVEEKYSDVGIRIIKPKATDVPMVEAKYRVRILIKCRDNRKTREMLNNALIEFMKDKTKKDIYMGLDINPMNIL